MLSEMTAFDADVIKCIDDFVCWCLLSNDNTNELLISKMLHSMSISLNALTKLFNVKNIALKRDTIKCADKIVWCYVKSDCIRCWNHQMHWRFCLMSEMLHSIVIWSNALTNYRCRNCCIHTEIVKYLGEIVYLMMSSRLQSMLMSSGALTIFVYW